MKADIQNLPRQFNDKRENSLLLFDILRSVLQSCKICIESIMILNKYSVEIVYSLLFLLFDIPAKIQSKNTVKGITQNILRNNLYSKNTINCIATGKMINEKRLMLSSWYWTSIIFVQPSSVTLVTSKKGLEKHKA